VISQRKEEIPFRHRSIKNKKIEKASPASGNTNRSLLRLLKLRPRIITAGASHDVAIPLSHTQSIKGRPHNTA
jgi:hypothetical protein